MTVIQGDNSNELMIKVKAFKCTRCMYIWIPRKKEFPKTCPNTKCHSPYWMKPRRSSKNQYHIDIPDIGIATEELMKKHKVLFDRLADA